MTKQGIFLIGAVVRRIRNQVKTTNGVREVVTYTLQAAGNLHQLNVWTPASYYEIGEVVEVPVYPKWYKGNVTWTLRENSGGEEF